MKVVCAQQAQEEGSLNEKDDCFENFANDLGGSGSNWLHCIVIHHQRHPKIQHKSFYAVFGKGWKTATV